MAVRSGAVALLADTYAFHDAFGLPVRQSPGVEIDQDLARLRIDLLEEGVSEIVTASEKEDLVGIADAVADVASGLDVQIYWVPRGHSSRKWYNLSHLAVRRSSRCPGPQPTGRRPSPYLLALLACVYGCTAGEPKRGR